MLYIPVAVVTLALAASDAHAQAISTPTLAPVTVTDTLESTVVPLSATPDTATRLGLTIKDTPASIDVVNQRAMQERGRATVIDAVRGVTGVTSAVRPGAAGVFSLRGFTENAVGVLFDGIRVGGSTVTTRTYDSFNFDRIDVLRGPASTLHGEGAGAGAINYVRRTPIAGPARIEAIAEATTASTPTSTPTPTATGTWWEACAATSVAARAGSRRPTTCATAWTTPTGARHWWPTGSTSASRGSTTTTRPTTSTRMMSCGCGRA
jgi:outer membrane receptor protein involved in Fe transport